MTVPRNSGDVQGRPRRPRFLPTHIGATLYAAGTQRLRLKLAALFFAVVLWVVAGAEEPTEARVPVTFAPSHDTALFLAGPAPALRALVAGRRRELLKLYRSPPVLRYAFLGDLPDTVRLQFRTSDVDLPPGVTARVLEVTPRETLLHFASRDPRRDSLYREAVRAMERGGSSGTPTRQRSAGAVAEPDARRVDTVVRVDTVRLDSLAPRDSVPARTDTARSGAPAAVADSLRPLGPRGDSARFGRQPGRRFPRPAPPAPAATPPSR